MNNNLLFLYFSLSLFLLKQRMNKWQGKSISLLINEDLKPRSSSLAQVELALICEFH